MGYRLLIVESPNKQKSITEYLKGWKVEGDSIRVRSSIGHITKLKTSGPRGYGFDTEGDEAFVPKYSKDMKNKKDIIKDLRIQIKEAEHVYLAADPDREGAMIAQSLVTAFKIPEEKYSRVVFHEVNKDAIKDAIKNPIEMEHDLIAAAEARRMLDRYIGFDLSKLCKKAAKAPSAGRVQSALLKLIYDHDLVVEAFVPEKYWTLGMLTDYNGIEIEFTGTKNITDKAKLDDYVADLQAQHKAGGIQITEFKYSNKTKSPKPPFTTASIQQEASSRLGFSPDRTMSTAQSLFSGKKINGKTKGLITYLRTDSERLNPEFVVTMDDYLKANGHNVCKTIMQSKKKQKGSQDAHEAIRPTDITLEPDKVRVHLSDDEYRLYDLIWRRTLAAKMNKCEYENQRVVVKVKDYNLTANRNKLKKPEYFAIYGKFEGSEFGEFIDEKGTALKVKKVTPEAKETKPPGRYSDAKLVQIMQDTGVGRPSTYASAIKTLKARGYLEKDKGGSKTTEDGRNVMKILIEHFPEVIESGYTASLEEKLDEIAEGNLDMKKFISESWKEFDDKYTPILAEIPEAAGPEPVKKCPTCEEGMLVERANRYNRNQKFLGCNQYPKCTHIESLDGVVKEPPKDTGYVCPKCAKPIVERISKREDKETGEKEPWWACSGYPKCRTIVRKEHRLRLQGDPNEVLTLEDVKPKTKPKKKKKTTTKKKTTKKK